MQQYPLLDVAGNNRQSCACWRSTCIVSVERESRKDGGKKPNCSKRHNQCERVTSDNKRECSFTVSERKKRRKEVHHRRHHHYVGVLSLPRRTTNDLAGGASSEAPPEPEPDPLANGWEGFRSRRTTNDRPVSAGLSSINTSSPGRASSPSLCRRGLRSWNQCRFLGWLTSGESSSVTGLTTSESCECLRNDDDSIASCDDGKDGTAAAFGGTGVCSITAVCDFLRTCGAIAPEGRLE